MTDTDTLSLTSLDARLTRLESIPVPNRVYVLVRDMFPVAVYRDREEAERQVAIAARGGTRCIANAALFELVLT